VKLKKMRGDVQLEIILGDDVPIDLDFVKLHLSTWLEVKRESDKKPLVKAERITFEINRDGDYIISGEGIQSSIFDYDDLTIDFMVLINEDVPKVEGGLTLHQLNFEAVQFTQVGAVFGVGGNLFYLGALADAKFQFGTLGGAFLFGKIDPDSIVLREMGFADLLETLGATGETGTLSGGYVRVYGDFPIYESGCMLRVNVGGEIAVWYFAAFGGESAAYGGRLRGYVYGKVLCVVSARGDLTLELSRPGHSDKGYKFVGQFWVAGGIGFCEPETWKSWESRWWGDGWCWTCGAMVSVDYNDTTADTWHWDYDAECE
jgi:hypothetical protein